MKNDCLFCAIIDGELPSYKVYEDEYFYVMLDRFPKCMGHTLILPKRHAVTIFDLQEEECRRLFLLIQNISVKLKEVLDFEGLNLLQNNGAAAGQEVNHFHMHLIPRYDMDAMSIRIKSQDPPAEEFEEMLERIKRVM